MTTLDVMMNWFAPETATLYCDECGCEMQSADGRRCKLVCDDCKRQRKLDAAYRNNRLYGRVKFDFRDDPATALVFAVIKQARSDKARPWQPPLDIDSDTTLSLAECDPAEFLSNGADAWLAALGIGIRQSMRDKLREAEL